MAKNSRGRSCLQPFIYKLIFISIVNEVAISGHFNLQGFKNLITKARQTNALQKYLSKTPNFNRLLTLV